MYSVTHFLYGVLSYIRWSQIDSYPWGGSVWLAPFCTILLPVTTIWVTRSLGMVSMHVSIPKPFSSGDVVEWFTRFEICSKEYGWSDAVMARKLPIVFEGDALANWLGLTEEKEEECRTAKEKITDKMKPTKFFLLDDYHWQNLRPSQPIPVFVYELKKFLDQAMLNLNASIREQLLLHQFLSRLPNTVSQQLRATGEMKTLHANGCRPRQTFDGTGWTTTDCTCSIEYKGSRGPKRADCKTDKTSGEDIHYSVIGIYGFNLH